MDKGTLFSYMPRYYKTSKVIDNINTTNSSELTLFKNRLDNTLKQFFVDTADYSLERWEKELGLEVDNKLDIDFRRSRIKSKLRGQGTITVKLMKNVAESYNNGEVEVIEHNKDYTFTIKFVSNGGIPQNLTDLKKAIEDIKPAHLAVTYDFKYMVWDALDNKNLTWDELDAKKISLDIFETGIW